MLTYKMTGTKSSVLKTPGARCTICNIATNVSILLQATPTKYYLNKIYIKKRGIF